MNERIKMLCKEHGITFAALEKRLGMGNATLKKANEKIQAVRLKALADYFDVSMFKKIKAMPDHSQTPPQQEDNRRTNGSPPLMPIQTIFVLLLIFSMPR